MVMPTLVGTGVAPARALTSFLPDNAAISYSDYCAVNVNSSRATFTRPISDGQGFEYTNPCARVRFKTNASYMAFHLRYTNLVTRYDTYNGYGVVLANGAPVALFNRVAPMATAWSGATAYVVGNIASLGGINFACISNHTNHTPPNGTYWLPLNSSQGPSGAHTFAIWFERQNVRTIELLMPHCASVDFEGVDIPTDATFVAAPARTAIRAVFSGDSITQGFNGADCRGWAYRVCAAKGWQCVNLGYGGRICTATDGTVLGNQSADVAFVMIGINDYLAATQTALATFKTAFKTFVTNFRAVNSTAKLYCITPTWSNAAGGAGGHSLEDYRQQIRDGLTELANAKNVLIEGAYLASNDLAHFDGGIHPTELGIAQIASNLYSQVSV